MSVAIASYERWRKFKALDPELRSELDRIRNDGKEIEERFGSSLEFGTAGLRGIIAAGTNRMNVYTVRKASLGLARFVIKNAKKPWSIAIAYDNRRKSRIFAETAAGVFASNGIRALIFDEIQPTPVLSYAVLHHRADAGVMITASHNPKEYNGYKVYWKHGGQVVDEFALAITDEFNAIDDELGIEAMGVEDAQACGLLEWIGQKTTESYMEKVTGLVTERAAIRRHAGLPIVYTPLYGTGYRLVPEALDRAGFEGVKYVEAQMVPDTEFGSVRRPKPEGPKLSPRACASERCRADLVMATDPDADRLGAMSREKDGSFRLITEPDGSAADRPPPVEAGPDRGEEQGSVLIKTIVTSDLGASVAEERYRDC